MIWYNASTMPQPIPIDISNIPELARIAEEVEATKTPRELKRENKTVEVIVPATKSARKKKRGETKTDYEAFFEPLQSKLSYSQGVFLPLNRQVTVILFFVFPHRQSHGHGHRCCHNQASDTGSDPIRCCVRLDQEYDIVPPVLVAHLTVSLQWFLHRLPPLFVVLGALWHKRGIQLVDKMSQVSHR